MRPPRFRHGLLPRFLLGLLLGAGIALDLPGFRVELHRLKLPGLFSGEAQVRLGEPAPGLESSFLIGGGLPDNTAGGASAPGLAPHAGMAMSLDLGAGAKLEATGRASPSVSTGEAELRLEF